MSPEEAFAGLTSRQWPVALCLFLIRRQSHIKGLLQNADRYAAFSEEITGWQQSQLSEQEKAESLFRICHQFGLIDVGQIAAQAPPEAPRTRGAVRARGKSREGGEWTSTTDTPAQLMNQVAQLYTAS